MAQFESGSQFATYENLMARAQAGQPLSPDERNQLLKLAWGPRMRDLETQALARRVPLTELPEFQKIALLPLRVNEPEFEELKRLAEHDARLPAFQRTITAQQMARLEDLSREMTRTGTLFNRGVGRATARDIADLEWIRDTQDDLLQALRGTAEKKASRARTPSRAREATPSRSRTPSRTAPKPVRKRGTPRQRLQKLVSRRAPPTSSQSSPFVHSSARMLPPPGFGQ